MSESQVVIIFPKEHCCDNSPVNSAQTAQIRECLSLIRKTEEKLSSKIRSSNTLDVEQNVGDYLILGGKENA